MLGNTDINGLKHAFKSGANDANNVGKRIVLPSSLTGNPRYLLQNYQDAISICRYYGCRDFFITFISNDRWKKIEATLSRNGSYGPWIIKFAIAWYHIGSTCLSGSSLDILMTFVYGHGGVCKTYLWNAITSGIRSIRKIVLFIASSYIASLLLLTGRTTHSRFKIPFTINECFTCQITKGTQLTRLVQASSLIVWDEAPLVHRHCFKDLDKTLRDVIDHEFVQDFEKPFGGKTILFKGDF
ncbi:Uncharacterized protein TCM_040203 [Theobroma cacao]|uniref:ATP-dependent DNA helicase n=1 Tax=Theobroma cacao TaxID=3641 RepID=A0A061GR81_THECC|nr:Uncharacterized protein TCM_040203 [Theobroma cacao]